MARTDIPAGRTETTAVAAPLTTTALAGLVALGVLLQGAFAGGFLSGHHVWRGAHETLGDLLIVLPLASLVVGLIAARRQPETKSVLASRVGLLVLLVLVITTGHAGRGLLALHIPAAIATVGLVTRQFVVASQAIRR